MKRVLLMALLGLSLGGYPTMSNAWYSPEEKRQRLIQRLLHPKDGAELAAALKDYTALADDSKATTRNLMTASMFRACPDVGCEQDLLADLKRLGPAAVPSLSMVITAATPEDVLNHWRIYAAICDTLGDLGPRAGQAVPTLIETVRLQRVKVGFAGNTPETLTEVATRAANALTKIGAPAVPGLEVALSVNRDTKPMLDAYANILKAIGTPEALAAIEKVQKKANDEAMAARKDAESQAREERETFAATLKKAQAGDPVAQNNLGAMYDEGEGTAEDTALAFKWYSKSFAQGYDVAERNLYALLRDEIMAKMLAEDVKWGKQPLNFMMPMPAVMGMLYNRERPLWVFVDATWEFSSNYAKREYIQKLLPIVRRYPLKIDAITIRRWDPDNNSVRELTYTEAPWKRVIFGDTLKTTTVESIAPKLPQGVKPEAPQEGALEQ